MTLEIQTLIVAAIVAGALMYVGRRVYVTMAKARRAKAAGRCASGCCD